MLEGIGRIGIFKDPGIAHLTLNHIACPFNQQRARSVITGQLQKRTKMTPAPQNRMPALSAYNRHGNGLR